MPLPTVLLAGPKISDTSILLPSYYSKSHEKLIDLAHRVFGKDHPRLKFEVHFHLKRNQMTSNKCEGKLQDWIWDEGGYFAEEFVQEDNLYLFAHFVKMPSTAFEDGKLQPTTSGPSLVPGSTPQEPSSVTIRPANISPSPLDRVTQPRKRQRVHKPRQGVNLNLETSGVKLRDMSQSTTTVEGERMSGKRSVIDLAHPAQNAGVSHLPKVMNYDWVELFIHWSENNALPGSQYHMPNWDTLNESHRQSVPHARLISTNDYGVPSAKSCDACVSEGKTCRRYRSDMKLHEWRVIQKDGQGVETSCAYCCAYFLTNCNAE